MYKRIAFSFVECVVSPSAQFFCEKGTGFGSGTTLLVRRFSTTSFLVCLLSRDFIAESDVVKYTSNHSNMNTPVITRILKHKDTDTSRPIIIKHNTIIEYRGVNLNTKLCRVTEPSKRE